MTEKIPASEMVQSLTGFDELAIEKHMKLNALRDGETNPMGVMRALVFVQHRRDGASDKDAYQAAMEMPMREVQAQFAEEPDEIDPENPETPAGEGSAPSE